MTRRSAEVRRTEILEATIAVMLERGFAGATTRDVTARLGVGRGLLHHYFASWEELQRTAFAWLGEAAKADAIAATAGAPPLERLDRLLDLMLARGDDAHWRLFADAWDEAQREAALARIHAEIGSWWRGQVQEAIENAQELGAAACPDAGAAAWRLSALADGLSSSILLAQPALSRDLALELLRGAVRQELGA